jgi:RNA polymerase II subunit A-like phosphatase
MSPKTAKTSSSKDSKNLKENFLEAEDTSEDNSSLKKADGPIPVLENEKSDEKVNDSEEVSGDINALDSKPKDSSSLETTIVKEDLEVSDDESSSDGEQVSEPKFEDKNVSQDSDSKEKKLSDDVEPKELSKSTKQTTASEMVEVEDTDDYLLYLEDILKTIHKAYYELYDQVCQS